MNSNSMLDRFIAAALLSCALLQAGPQSGGGSPEFEVATLKPSLPSTEAGAYGGPGTDAPGQIRFQHVNLRWLLARAYGAQRFQIDGPSGFDSDYFDFAAKVPPGATEERIESMLQKLLADRFHLQLHRETRTQPVYELIIAKGGLKMMPVAAPVTVLPASSREAPVASVGMQAKMVGDMLQVSGRGITMRVIVNTLIAKTRRDVVDKTGLTGNWDFEVSFVPPPPSPEFNFEANAEALDNAMEKQMGLKVDFRKVPVEMFIIDRFDRKPADN